MHNSLTYGLISHKSAHNINVIQLQRLKHDGAKLLIVLDDLRAQQNHCFSPSQSPSRQRDQRDQTARCSSGQTYHGTLSGMFGCSSGTETGKEGDK